MLFNEFGLKVLDGRELDGIRSVASERSKFACHLADWSEPLEAIRPMHVFHKFRYIAAKDSAKGGKLSRATALRCFSLISAIMNQAVLEGIIATNPCIGLKLPKLQAQQTEDTWAYLTLEEQKAVQSCEAIPEYARLLLQVAWGTGLRAGEMWALELRDVHLEGENPYVFVRFGSHGKLPKSGKTRRVELFGHGLAAMKRWLEILPSYASENPHGLCFPGSRGQRRQTGGPETTEGGKKVELLSRWLGIAGVTKHLRWHDLRHTFCTSLISGYWGRTWSLDEVRDIAGHSSVTTTQRYAHMSDCARKKAARETLAA